MEASDEQASPTRGGAFCVCLIFAGAGAAQQTTKQGNTLSADSNGALRPGVPFGCNVDGNVFPTITSCVSFLTATGATGVGGVITENAPEHITTLPWNPGTFSGIVQLGNGLNGNTCPSSMTPNCWLTDVPIILGQGMMIAGSGEIQAGSSLNFANGTAIVPGPNFPAPLGQPSLTSGMLSCATTGGHLAMGTYLVEVVEVNDLDTFTGSLPMHVPGLSAVSSEQMVSCTNSTSTNLLTVTLPTALAPPGSINAKDGRVFVTTSAAGSGSESLQLPGSSMACSTRGVVDPSEACELGGGATATINTLQTGGDAPNLIDLSNPLVADIGAGGSSDGFWARLQYLALDTLGSHSNANNPNVAYWNPTDQENSGLSFVELVGEFGSSTDVSLNGGAWIYIGPHAPNSFLANVQTDTNPSGGTFTGVILDGRPGFGTSGTARVVSNSTFAPGRASGSTAIIPAGILITGKNAVTDFNQVHVETPTAAGNQTDSNFEVTNGATVSVVGPTQFGNTIVHLTPTGTAITVKNVLGSTGSQVVEDDLNGVNNLGTYVANYSSLLQAGALKALNSLTLPNQNANLVFAGPASGGAAAPAFRALATADLPTGGTVQVLGGAVNAVTPPVYLPWLGGSPANGNPTQLSPIIPSAGTITDLFVGVASAYGVSTGATFTVASCTPSGTNCIPAASSIACTISGATQTQCSDSAHTLSLSKGDEVFLHATAVGSPGNKAVFMSYRLTGVQ